MPPPAGRRSLSLDAFHEGKVEVGQQRDHIVPVARLGAALAEQCEVRKIDKSIIIYIYKYIPVKDSLLLGENEDSLRIGEIEASFVEAMEIRVGSKPGKEDRPLEDCWG